MLVAEHGLEFGDAVLVAARAESFGGFGADELVVIGEGPFEEGERGGVGILGEIGGSGGASGSAFAAEIGGVFGGGDAPGCRSEHGAGRIFGAHEDESLRMFELVLGSAQGVGHDARGVLAFAGEDGDDHGARGRGIADIGEGLGGGEGDFAGVVEGFLEGGRSGGCFHLAESEGGGLTDEGVFVVERGHSAFDGFGIGAFDGGEGGEGEAFMLGVVLE